MRLSFGALLLALILSSPSQAQVWFARSGSYYQAGSGSVVRYSNPFVPGVGIVRGSPAPAQFTWYTVGEGYTYGQQTGLPWRQRDIQYRRRDMPQTTGESAVAFSRSFRPSRRAYYAREGRPGTDAIAGQRQQSSDHLQEASARQAVRNNPRTATAPSR